MSTWRKRFSRKSQRINENDEILINNSSKYKKKIQAAIAQITRTKKAVQRNLDSPTAEVHVARLINDIGQLSDCKPLQEITSLIDSLAMRHQLSSRIFNEYAMNALHQSLRKLNDDLSNDFDKTRSLFEEAVANHCSDHTKKQLFSKMQNDWSKHQKLAVDELKKGLSSYCDIGMYNLRVQMAILEKLQTFVDQLPRDENEITSGLSNFSTNSIQTRREIDTMLRIMLDTAPNTDTTTMPLVKRPKFLDSHLTLSNSLYSPEISEAAACSSLPIVGQRHTPVMSQYDSAIRSPLTPQNGRAQNTYDDDALPSYTDLFVVPSHCKDESKSRRNTYGTN